MTFLRVRNSGTAELGGSGLESREFAVKMLPGRCLQKACLGLEDPLPRWLTPVAGKLMLAIGRRPEFLTAWLFGLLWYTPVWVANLPRVSNPRRNEEVAVFFYYLALKVTHCPLHWILLAIQTDPDTSWEGSTQRHEHWRRESLGNHLGDWLPH